MPTQTTDLFLLEDLEDGGAESWGEAAGNGISPPRTTCRPWSSPAPATGSPSRPPRDAGGADRIPGPVPRRRVNPQQGDHTEWHGFSWR